jgi:hypothetical protein
MIGDINLNLKPREIEIFLAKPDRVTIAKLNESYNKNVSVLMGNINELTFNVPYSLDFNHTLIDNPNVSLVRNRYLLKVKIGTQEEWYTIRSVVESGEEDSEYKQVKAYLLPYEMNDNLIRTFQEDGLNLTSVLMGGTVTDSVGTSRQITGILDETKWSVGYVDADFDTKFRSFDFTSTTVLDAVMQIAETFQAIIKWDTINREISFVKQEDYGINMGLTMSHGKYLQSVSRDSNSDEMATRLFVEGADGLSIQRINPTGTNYIDDFSTFMYPFQRDASKNVIQSSYYMSDALCNAILDYNEFLAGKVGAFGDLLDQETAYQTTLTQKENDMATLQEQLAVIRNNIDIENSAGHDTTQPTTIEEQFYSFSLPITFGTSNSLKINSATLVIDNLKFADYPATDFLSSIKVNGIEVFSNDKTKWSTGSYNGSLNTPAGTDIVVNFKANYTYSVVSKIQVKIKNETSFIDPLSDASLVNMIQITTGTSLVAKLNQKNTEITNKQTEIDGVNAQITSVDTQIEDLRASVDSSNFINPTLQEELKDYIIKKEWVDQNYIYEQELYDDAIKYFEKLKQPQIIIEISLVNFLKIVEAQRDWDKLNLGDTITIKYDQLGINATAKIIGFEISEENDDITLTIANTQDVMSDNDKLIKAVYNSTGTTTTVDLSKRQWDNAVSTASSINQIINGQWDAIGRSIVAGVNNSVEISERGILVKNSTDPLSYLVIQNGVMAITNDNGNTWKHAITKDGIVGERIFGKLLAGVNLLIDASDSSGVKTFTVDANGVTLNGSKLTITGGGLTTTLANGVVIDATNGITITRTDGIARVILNATKGLSFQKSAGGGTWTDKFYYDSTSGNLILDGQLNAKSIKINGVEVIAGNFISGTMIDKLSVSKLDVSTAKITTAMIETLTVGTNVVMGPSATIAWTNVTGAPVSSWTNPSYITSTKITSTTIESPAISAGTINGTTITGAQINGGNINVTSDLFVGDNITLGTGLTRKTITFNSGAIIQSLNSAEIKISAENTYIWDGNVNIGNSNTAVYRTNFYGLVDFSSATVAGIHAVFG